MSLSPMWSIENSHLLIPSFPLICRVRFQFLRVMSLALHYQPMLMSSVLLSVWNLYSSTLNSRNTDQVFCKYYAVSKLGVWCQLLFLWNTLSSLYFFTLITSILSLVLSWWVTSGDSPWSAFIAHISQIGLSPILCFHSTQWKLLLE